MKGLEGAGSGMGDQYRLWGELKSSECIFNARFIFNNLLTTSTLMIHMPKAISLTMDKDFSLVPLMTLSQLLGG
jgi:hypothetical protein